jgi:hypothetical protein
MSLLSAAALVTATCVATATPAASAAAHVRWHSPDCGQVQSNGLLTFTTDEGASVTPTTGETHETRYIFDIAALATPNEMLAVDDTGALFLSVDAGCSWSQVNQVPEVDEGRLEAASDGSAYLWNGDGTQLMRVTGARVSKLPPLEENTHLIDLVVDPRDGRHLRAILKDGRVLDSTDGGAHFREVGRVVATRHVDVKSAGIDPRHLDHIVAGTYDAGTYTTFNGGRSWAHDGMGRAGDLVAVSTISVSPVSSKLVYEIGVNGTEGEAGLPSEGRHLYRSTDGGRTFAAVLDDHTGDVRFQNGSLLVASPTNAYEVYFVFSEAYLGHGTDLYTFDTRHGRLSVANARYARLEAVAFNPGDPTVMYLGFGAELIS